jgi:MFS family permease
MMLFHNLIILMQKKSSKRFLGWQMVFLAIFIDFMAVGFTFQASPIIQLILEKEFNISRTLVTSTIPLLFVVSGLLFPLVGNALDYFSIRKILITGSILYGLGLVALSFANTFAIYLAIFTLPVATGFTLMGNISLSKLVSRWFNIKAGQALGMAAIGVSLAGLIMPSLTQYLLNFLSWQELYLYFGGVILAVVMPFIWFGVVEDPKMVSQNPDNKEPSAEQDALLEGRDWKNAHILKDTNFWVLIVSFSFQFATIAGVLGHITFYAASLGWSLQAGYILSSYAIPAIIGKIFFGWLVDKIDARMTVSISLLIQSIAVLSIFLAESPIELALIIAFFGFGLGGALPLSNILFTKTYTEQSFGRARGLAGPFLLPIQVAGTPLAAFLFDLYGNYNLAFSILGIAPTLGIITIWFLRLPKKAA